MPLDPDYPVERLRYMVEDSAPVALLTQAHLTDLLCGVDHGLPMLNLNPPDPRGDASRESNLDVTPSG